MAEQGRMIAGRYEVLEEIGRGGMGLVARAYDHRLATEVAIKVLRQDLSKDSGDKDSLIKEGRVLARLTHPSIVRLFDLADTEIGLMLVLEYVKGPNLAASDRPQAPPDGSRTPCTSRGRSAPDSRRLTPRASSIGI